MIESDLNKQGGLKVHKKQNTSEELTDRRKIKKAVGLIVSAVLLVAIAVGGTFAWLISKTDVLNNSFTVGTVSVEVDEELDGNTKKNVTIKNTGTADAYIRATVVFNWVNVNGDMLYGEPPYENIDYTVSYNTTDWIHGSDGYWYYKYKVSSQNSTNNLINTLTPTADKGPKGEYSTDSSDWASSLQFYLGVNIVGAGIQANPSSTVVSEWGVTVNSDGTLNVK